MMHRPLPLTSSFVLLASLTLGGELPRAEPEAVGLSAGELAKLTAGLNQLVEAGRLPGGVVMIARRGKVAYSNTFGYRNLEARRPMTEDTIFAIASMTKPVTCVAAMMLVEQGKLRLDDPVAKYLPELKDLRVIGDAKDDTATEVATVPAKREVTIRDLLAHTSGFTYAESPTISPRLRRCYTQAGVFSPELKTIADQVSRLAKVPLAFQPGEGWSYSPSHDVLGRVIEVISGKSLDAFFQEKIFQPLDLRDTSFYVPESKRDRLATIYRATLDKGLTPLPEDRGSKTFFAGGRGLFSTARDYTRFAQMLLNGGALDGVRMLKPETVAAMTSNQIGLRTAMGSMKYGLGFGLDLRRGSDGGAAVLHRYFWDGAYSTSFSVDPRRGVVAVAMTQVVPSAGMWSSRGYVGTSSSPSVMPRLNRVYPVKVSRSGRYFVDQNGEPVFWLGTTQWQLFREYSLDDARTIIEKSKATGFDFAQVMLMGVGDGTKPNVHGDKPWINDDPLTPNEAYFRNVDAVVRIARENNFNISMTLYHQRYRKAITREKARGWAKWLAHRYKDVPTIVWSMTPEAKPEFVPVLRELAAGLREGDGGSHLITFKPDPAPYSSSFIHDESWLDFDSMQTWKSVELIYPFVTKDYNLKPVKPVLMAEGAYEHGSEYGFDVTPLWVRRQAYYSYLAGGHHTYGHNDSWRVLPTWKQALDAPGAAQLGILKKAFQGLDEWWRLVPDQEIFDRGGNTAGQVLNLAARHEDGRWVLAYLGSKSTVSIKLGKLASGPHAKATWMDPRDGKRQPAGEFTKSSLASFSTPEGWEDALLILEAMRE